MHHRSFDDRYFCDLILEYLRTKGEGRRPDFDRLLKSKLSDLLSDEQKNAKIKNLLQRLRREGQIVPDGNTQSTIWRLTV